jgi:parallel beta-helix repeat protein
VVTDNNGDNMTVIGKARMGMIAIAAVMLVAAGVASADGACIGATTVFGPGDVVTESCTFNGDINCSIARYGLIIGANNITIDGAGYTLGRADPGECAFCPSAGVLNKGYDNVTITNLEIEHFCNGIYLNIDEDCGNVVYRNTIENCNIHHNGNATSPSATYGIKMRYVFNSTIRNNSIHDQIAHVDPNPGCEDGGNGLFLYTGDYNNIIENRFYNNTKAGMLIKMQPKYWNISHNHLWGNGQGGIILRCKLCDFNLIEHNNASGNYGSGIFIGGNDNIIRYNTVCNNRDGGPYYEDSIGGHGYGINIGRSDGSLDNTLISNTVCGNDYLDITVVTGVTGNTGDCNTCNTTENYNDDGTTGCTYSCVGDLNCDGVITPADAVIALQMTVRGELTADGWTLYGTDQCGGCIRQKEEFGDAFGDLTYINCIENRSACIDAGIKLIPCWASPNGTLHPGYHNLTRLSELVSDYQRAHPTPTPTTARSTSPATIGFEPIFALTGVLTAFLLPPFW